MRTILIILIACIFAALNATLITKLATKQYLGIDQELRLLKNLYEQPKQECGCDTRQMSSLEQSIDDLDRMPLSDSGILIWGQEHTPSTKGQHLLFPIAKILNTSLIAKAWDDEEIDVEYERKRCAKYGFDYSGNRTSRRRIFWGTNIADESFRMFQTVATEVYDMFDTVSFIESNTSASLTPREWRFLPDTDDLEALRSIFGKSTRVSVDYYIDGPKTRPGFVKEQTQRQSVLERWRRNGMRQDDIGIFGDADEMFFRDVLRALQICDVPEFRPGQDCKSPKILGSTLMFESSPQCIHDSRVWFHPDAVIGECIEGIGDESTHPPPRRNVMDRHGWRINGHGRDGNYSDYFKENPQAEGRYPLWNSGDVRMVAGGRMINQKQKYTAFHLHNNFLNSREVRDKYTKNAEATGRANTVPLGLLHEDVGMVVSCVHNISATAKGLTLLKGGYNALQGSRPLLYHNAEFRSARHQEVVDLVLEDERRYGKVLNASCRNADCDTCDFQSCEGYKHRDKRVFQILKDIDKADDVEYLRKYIETLQQSG